MRWPSFAELIGGPFSRLSAARGYSIEDAQDLTQDFFVTILKKNWLQHADRNRGRFRSLLLKSLQNFLINAAEKTHAHKRGGDVEFISWDDWMAEAPSQLSIPVQALDSLPPERIFDLTLGDDGCGTRASTPAGRMREQRQALAFPSTKLPSYRRTR